MKRPAARPQQRAAHPLHVCAGCGEPFVQPSQVLDHLDDGRWLVELRCASCGLRVVGAHADEALEALDLELERGYQQLRVACAQLARDNEREAVEAFGTALHADHILPEDF